MNGHELSSHHASAEAGLGTDQQPALRALSRELSAAREMALELQETVAELLTPGNGGPSAAMFRLQTLDRLTQTLEDLAGYAGALARGAPAGWTPDLSGTLDALRLRDLAARLSGSAPAPGQVSPPAPAPVPSPTPLAGGDDYLF